MQARSLTCCEQNQFAVYVVKISFIQKEYFITVRMEAVEETKHNLFFENNVYMLKTLWTKSF